MRIGDRRWFLGKVLLLRKRRNEALPQADGEGV